mgnify:CR=1 FL=1
MARYGCTITVAAGKIPSSQSNFSWLATEANFPTAAIDGGAQSILNGGGNLRCYTDSTKATQIPVEVVAFVTGGTPSVLVWGLSPTLAVSSTVYIEADTVATTQPIVTNTYGRNSVWTNDLKSYHLRESSGTTATDSAGNTDGTYSGSLPTVGADFGQDFDGTDDFVDTTNSTINMSAFTFSAKIKPDILSGSHQIYTADKNTTGDRFWQWRVESAGVMRIICWDSGNTIFINTAGTTAISASTEYVVHFAFDGSNYKTYIDGVVDLNIANTSIIKSLGAYSPRIGAAETGVPVEEFNGQIGDVIVRDGAFKSDNYIATEYNNQSDPSTFWTTSAWTDQDAGGGTTGTITQTASSFTQSLAGTVVLPNTTGTITQTTGSFTQSLAGTVLSAAVTGTINQAASSFTQSLSGTVLTSITGTVNQTTSSFTQSASGTMRVNITGSANQTTSSFNQSLLGAIAEPVLGTITQTTGSFTQSANGVVAEEIAGTITQTLSSFTMSASGKIPALWFDKAPATTSWTDKV